MERRSFVKQCMVLSAIGISSGSLLSACAAFKTVPFNEQDQEINIAKADLPEIEHKIAVIYPKQLSYPVAISKTENGYQALLMSCTHQGAVLNAYGSQLICEAHGSTFTADGTVNQGPAKMNLKSFATQESSTHISILLK